MGTNDGTENIFTGEWRVVSLYCNVVDRGWTLFKRYGRGSFVWEFYGVGSLRSPGGSVIHCGLLRESRLGHKPETTEYTYRPAERLLYIDRSGCGPDDLVNICIGDRYRVEHIRGDEYWLYDLEGVENEPGDYRFRMKVRKICSERSRFCVFEGDMIRVWLNANESESVPAATIKDFLTVRQEGKRNVSRNVEFYNLDAII